jgi:hypothetical protein
MFPNRSCLSLLLLLALAQPLAACSNPEPPRVGSYRPVDPASPEVQTAKAEVQKHFTNLRIQSVSEAYAQVVAGMNFKLVCKVLEDDADSTWEFVVWRKLDGTWKLTSAQRV